MMSRIRMADLITPERIIPRLHAADKLQVIEKLSRLVAAYGGMNVDLVQRAVLSRGDLTTFGVGRGIAIPHAVVPGIAEPIGAFARLDVAINFDAADGRAVDLVLLLLAPEADAGILLPALSRVARRLRDRAVAKHLRAQTSAEAAHVILTTDSWRGPGAHSDWRHVA